MLSSKRGLVAAVEPVVFPLVAFPLVALLPELSSAGGGSDLPVQPHRNAIVIASDSRRSILELSGRCIWSNGTSRGRWFLGWQAFAGVGRPTGVPKTDTACGGCACEFLCFALYNIPPTTPVGQLFGQVEFGVVVKQAVND